MMHGGPPQVSVDEQHAPPVRLTQRQRDVDRGEGLPFFRQGAPDQNRLQPRSACT
jgi:hypothetical protein